MHFLLKLTLTFLLSSTALHSMEMEVVQQAPVTLKAESFQKSIIGRSGRQTQIRVANQFDRKNGGASCGLEAFLNAYILSPQQIQQREGDVEQVIDQLESIEIREELFGDISKAWQELIAVKRARTALKDELIFQLIESLNCEKRIAVSTDKTKQEAIVSFGSQYIVEIIGQSPELLDELKKLISCLANFASHLSQVTEFEGNMLKCQITCAEIRNCIVAQIHTVLFDLEGNKNPELEKQAVYRSLLEKLDDYIELRNIDLSFQLEEVEWITDDEIHALTKAFAKGYYIFRVGSIARGEALAHECELFGNKFQRFLADYRDPNKDAHAAFTLYIKDHPLNFFTDMLESSCKSIGLDIDCYLGWLNTKGHWVTVVVNKVDNQVEILLTNSAANKIIINHQRVVELMEYLDGRETDERRSLHESFWTKPQVIAAVIVVAFVAAIAQQNKIEPEVRKFFRSMKISDEINVELPPYGVLPLSLHRAQVCRLYSELAAPA